MMNVSEFSDTRCCGCGMCIEICSTGCITMRRDREGFARPVIDASRCADCGLCAKQCPFQDLPVTGNTVFAVYAAKSRDVSLLNTVSSGGIGYLLASRIIKDGGVVYGSGFDRDFRVKHMRASNLQQLENLKLSKYVQSDTTDVYGQIIGDLTSEQRKKVLFIGTACQTAALKKLLDIKSINSDCLYLCDVLCHGVPSPGIYEEYLEYAKAMSGSDIKSIRFRGKRFGWKNPSADSQITFENGKTQSLENYLNLYFDHYTLRPSCTSCPYTVIDKPSDITLADFWTAEELLDDFDITGGVTMTVIHTSKGKQLFDTIAEDTVYAKADSRALNARQFVKPAEPRSDREKFWKIYNESGLVTAMRKCRRRYPLRVALSRAYHVIRRKITHEG